MKKLLLLLTIITLYSCGKMDHTVEGVPKDFNVTANINDGYKELYAFCDARYGVKTEDSDKCIEDGKQFRNVKAGIDLSELETYCSKAYDVEACHEDVLDFISNHGF